MHRLRRLRSQINYFPFFGHCRNRKDQRIYFDELGKKLGIKKLEDWYNVDITNEIRIDERLLYYYKGSIIDALRSVYDEFDWIPWKFTLIRLPRRFWTDPYNVQRYLRWISMELQLVEMASWKQISNQDIRSIRGGGNFLHCNGGLFSVLSTYFPRFTSNWKASTYDNENKRQKLLFHIMQLLFPYAEFSTNYCRWPKRSLQLDIFSEKLSLALEYQGIGHYRWLFKCGPPERQKERDRHKRTLCEAEGLTLIEIPCWWWNGNMETLIESIVQHRPDLRHVCLHESGKYTGRPKSNPKSRMYNISKMNMPDFPLVTVRQPADCISW